jgi:signal transduction histidine kinase/DNA-binding NarL/FixJ family response regulator/purine-cytosine permease-like protein
MKRHQRIVRIRRNYNKWVGNETLEDYALRFTAKSARKWSSRRVANTAIGAISFLALEAIGGSITINYGFVNAAAAIVAVGGLIFLTSLPIAYYAATYGVDIDLLTRGAGFGYLGSTVTSLIYASFTFLFFAIEAAIMALALEMWLGLPLAVGYVVSSVIVIPLVTHGIAFISRLQLWTQPIWIVLHVLPFAAVAAYDPGSFASWIDYGGRADAEGLSFSLVLFGAASTVVFSLVAQIGEQVDFLRFLPAHDGRKSLSWWAACLGAGPGWIIPGLLKLLAGSFLASLAVRHLVPTEHAAEPTQMYLVAFSQAFASPRVALAFACTFVIVSQIKINVTNAYAGSIAWSNFFSRLTHSHPGRVVWLAFNVAIALLLMELGIFKVLEHILGLYSFVAVGWVGALVADLVVNKPLGLSPPFIEFKRAHLYDINPVGVGAMVLGAAIGIVAYSGAFGAAAHALSSFIALGVAFVSAPAIAGATSGRFYLARTPDRMPDSQKIMQCCICEHHFEAEDIAQCPAYSGPICSLCCSLETRCRDYCKPEASLSNQVGAWMERTMPHWSVAWLRSDIGRYAGVLAVFAAIIAAALTLAYVQVPVDSTAQRDILRATLMTVFFILSIFAGIAAWFIVLTQGSRRVAEQEMQRQTELLMQEIEAHRRTDAKLQEAKEKAEAASKAKSRYVVGLSHELRTPLNAVVGYAQILERDSAIPVRRLDAIRTVRRNAEYLSGLIDGLLDISKIEAGRFHLNRNEVWLREYLDQLVSMFRLQAEAKGVAFRFEVSDRLPPCVYTDENRLRQILINLLSNAVKFTDAGHVAMRIGYRNQVAAFEVEDTGIGIPARDLDRIFQPFGRSGLSDTHGKTGTGLGLTITRMLAETMGGEITVRSEVGRGSTFQVKLMLSHAARSRDDAPMEDRVRGYAGPRQTIMITDDDPVHRDLVCELLEPLGFEVITAPEGAACLALADEHRPKLVLLDVLMPRMNGWDVARRLRQMPRERPAIIMLSALAMDHERPPDCDHLHDAYLTKPINLRQLLDKIHTLLGLEWIVDSDGVPPSEISRPFPLPAEGASPPLSPKEVEALIRLGEIGHVRGIIATLDEIERNVPQSAAMVTELRNIVHSFNFSRFLTVLKAQRRDHAS